MHLKLFRWVAILPLLFGATLARAEDHKHGPQPPVTPHLPIVVVHPAPGPAPAPQIFEPAYNASYGNGYGCVGAAALYNPACRYFAGFYGYDAWQRADSNPRVCDADGCWLQGVKVDQIDLRGPAAGRQSHVRSDDVPAPVIVQEHAIVPRVIRFDKHGNVIP